MMNDFSAEVCQPFRHRGGSCGILLIHGYTGTCAHMRKLADALAEKGHTVRTFNLPGHAQSEESMAATGCQDWINAAMQEAEALRAEVSSLVICGLSMGADIALILSSRLHPDACVSISAPMGAKNPLLPLSGALKGLVPHIKKRARLPELAQLLDPAYDMEYTGYYTNTCQELQRIIRTARESLKDLLCPLLVIQSDRDETISQKSAGRILRECASRHAELLTLQGMPHVCTISPALPQIADAMDHFIRKFVHAQDSAL